MPYSHQLTTSFPGTPTDACCTSLPESVEGDTGLNPFPPLLKVWSEANGWQYFLDFQEPPQIAQRSVVQQADSPSSRHGFHRQSSPPENSAPAFYTIWEWHKRHRRRSSHLDNYDNGYVITVFCRQNGLPINQVVVNGQRINAYPDFILEAYFDPIWESQDANRPKPKKKRPGRRSNSVKGYRR